MMLLQETLDTFVSDTKRPIAVPQAPQKGARKHRASSASTQMVNRITPYLARSVASDLSMFRAQKRRFSNKKRLVAAYIDDCDRLNEAAVSVRKFLYDAVFASLVYGGPKGQKRQGVENTLLNATEMIAGSLEAPLVPQSLETDARLIVSNDVSELQTILLHSLEDACYSFVDNIFGTLQHGVNNFIFGRVDNLMEGETLDDGKSSAVRYCYFTRRINDSYRYTGDDRTKAEGAIDVALHVHDVVDAKLVPLPARGVAKPKWIPPVLDAVPPVLARIPGAVTVLTGDITLERVFVRRPEVEQRINQYPMHCDPALLIANTFVLTGWNPTDIRSRTMLRQWTPDAMRNKPVWHETSLPVRYRRKVLGQPNRPKLQSAWQVGR